VGNTVCNSSALERNDNLVLELDHEKVNPNRLKMAARRPNPGTHLATVAVRLFHCFRRTAVRRGFLAGRVGFDIGKAVGFCNNNP
jgi:hypothetical protein